MATIVDKSNLDTRLGALLVNNTRGEIEADEVLAILLDFVESAANTYPGSTIYINGDSETDGSIRLVPDLSSGTELEVQRRSDGVWNDTGIVIAASTIYLGRELQISAAGEYMLTKDGHGNQVAGAACPL